MMINIKDNYLTRETCVEVIKAYHDNESKIQKYRDRNFLKINDFGNIGEELDKESFLINNSTLDWVHIVKWPKNSEHNLHIDDAKLETALACIIYLNEDYLGGQTYFEDGTIIAPKTGRALFFDGRYYKHGVKCIKEGTRYTIAAWFKNKPILKREK